MKTLCIDTTSLVASVGIIEDKKILSEFTINCIRNHSKTLMVLIEDMFKIIDMELKDIDNIAVTNGPGSFTGQRVGVATAMALASAIQKDVLPINTLDLLKENARDFVGIVIPIIDARRSEVYFSIYEKGEKLRNYDLKHIDEVLALCKSYDKEVIFTGDGVLLHKEKIESDGYKVASNNNYFQRVSSMSELIEKSQPVRYDEVELFYLKQTEAERVYNLKNVKIVEFDIKYLDEILEIEKKSFAQPWTRGMFEDEAKNSMANFFIALIDEKVVGYISSRYIINEGHITNVAICDKYRRQGIGKKLITYLVDYYKEQICIGLTLEVNKNNEGAIKTYESLGFVLEGERKNYYENGEDAYIMWLYI
ncbi:MAG: tRNA (adenosine(37)-N6)-threonylcarbamoyltransferase complex dimerization subunit type 1 TsaB [Lachnospirales bacterium]